MNIEYIIILLKLAYFSKYKVMILPSFIKEKM